MLTVVIADDLLALVVIALVYSDSIDVRPLIWAAGLFAVALVLLLGLKLRRGPPYFVLGSAMWVVALDPGIDAPVTVVEYGDFECPYCGRAEPAVRELLRDFADVRYVWRQLPPADVHPHAKLAALASETAADQGAFWNMHDQLLEHQDKLRMADLVSYADRLGLDVARLTEELQGHVGGEPDRPGRGGRGPEPRVRHAHVLHQRAPPPRRIRHRPPLARSPRRRRPRQAGGVVARSSAGTAGRASPLRELRKLLKQAGPASRPRQA
jgi:hypothetical protein